MLALKFRKIRMLLFAHLSRLIAWVLFVPFPPIIAASAIIEKDGSVLVLKHTYIKGYGFPGGVVESGETLESALVREVKEETGFEVESMEYLFSTEGKQYGFSAIVGIYKVSVSGEVKESSEGSLHWMKPTDLIGKMAYRNAEQALKKYIDSK